MLLPLGQASQSPNDLAGRFGVAAPLFVKAGTDVSKLLKESHIAEALRLRSAILLLFEDAGEAAEFEKATRLARATAQGAKAAERGRRYARTRPTNPPISAHLAEASVFKE